MRTSLLGRELDHDSLFARLSEEFCSVLGRHGIVFRPYESDKLRLFSRLSPDLRAIILAGLEETLSTWAEAETEGDSLLDSPRLLWRTLSRLKLAPQPDIFDKIKDGDVVEIYTPEFRQIFRNLNFFRYFSCTLEELVSIPGPELATFPPATLQYYLATIRALAEEKIKSTFVPEIGPYEVDELVGAERLRLQIRVKYLSPILENGRGVAVISVNESTILSKNASAPS